MTDRHRQRGLHGHRHIDHQRRTAMIMIGTGLCRVLVWSTICVLFIAGQSTVTNWFGSVKFVALLSILALMLTDWGQVAASLAQLTAGDAHHDAEAARREVALNADQLEADVARLAVLHPGPAAKRLSDSICRRIKATP